VNLFSIPVSAILPFDNSADVSDEAKAHSQDVIDELGDAHYGLETAEDKDEGNVLRG
jgi:hypothetical protein